MRISNLDDNAINPITLNSQRYSSMTRRMFTTFPNCIVILSHCTCRLQKNGAGDGNRTHVIGLGSRRSAIELHPRKMKNTRRRYSALLVFSILYRVLSLMSTQKTEYHSPNTDEMANPPFVASLAAGWNNDLNKPKHYRHLSSLIAHEPDRSEGSMSQ